MRLLIAIGLFMASLVLLLLGVAERTIWAPPPSYKMSVDFEAANPFVVISNQTLSAHPGTPYVYVDGPRDVFIATGRENDIRSWVGATPFTEVAADKKAVKLEATSVAGSEPAISPVNSDLWRISTNHAKSATILASPEDSGAVLIASDGVLAAPGQVRIVWPIAYDLLPSNLFLLAGMTLLLVALVMNIISYRAIRRRRGPSRKMPKPPQGPKVRLGKQPRMAPAKGRRAARKVMHLTTGLVLVGIASGCSTGAASPTPTPTATGVLADPPVINQAQLERILKDVSIVVGKGDAAKKREALLTRVAGPALDQRVAWYSLMAQSSKLKPLPVVAAKPITFSLPAATEQWPRSIMAVTDQPGDESPQMLVLVQETPRSNYQLWYNIRLMQGATIPSVPVASIGAIPVEPSAKFLKAVPNELPSVYGSIIDNGAGIGAAGLFDLSQDQFFKQISESQDSQVAALKNGKITFSHTVGSPKVVSLATTDGGALVAVSMIDGYTIRPTKSGSAITVTGLERLMLGASGSAKGIISRYSDMLLFYVPKQDSTDKIKVLGVTQALLSVRSR